MKGKDTKERTQEMDRRKRMRCERKEGKTKTLKFRI